MSSVYLKIGTISSMTVSLLFFVRGINTCPTKGIALLSSFSQSYNPILIRAYYQHTTDIKVGFAFFSVSFLFQLFYFFAPVTESSRLEGSKIIFCTVCSTFVLFICAYFTADIISLSSYKEAMAALIK